MNWRQYIPTSDDIKGNKGFKGTGSEEIKPLKPYLPTHEKIHSLSKAAEVDRLIKNGFETIGQEWGDIKRIEIPIERLDMLRAAELRIDVPLNTLSRDEWIVAINEWVAVTLSAVHTSKP